MRQFVLALVLVLGLTGATQADDKMEYKVHGPYFESNKSGLKGDSSYLFFSSKDKFGDVLRPVPPLMKGKKADPVKDASFTDGVVLAVIKRGASVTTYKVEEVTFDKAGILKVRYTATAGKPGTATFASPLVVSVAKKDVKVIEYIENGKKVETINTGR